MLKPIDYSIYLVTDRDLMSTATIEEAVESAILGGVTLVQLREKQMESLDFYNEAIIVKAICDKYSVPLIINDRFDIALAVDADGVHIGQSDIPAAVARKLIGNDKILGVSATNIDEAIKAYEDGADYLGVGAMFATGTKSDAKIVSKDELIDISNRVNLPIVIIGGINCSTISQFDDVDIDGISVVSAIIAQEDITSAATEVRDTFMAKRRRIVRGIKAAIFDLDGTILDSMDVWNDIDIEFLNKRGLSVTEEYMSEVSAMSFRETAEFTIRKFNLPDNPENIMSEWHHMAIERYSSKVKLLPYVKEYLYSLNSSGIKLGVATSLSRELYEPCLKANGIYDLFDTICSVDEVGQGKNSPEIYRHAAGKLGVCAAECIIFEDVLPAISSAKRFGAVVYGVYDKYSSQFMSDIRSIADGYIMDFNKGPIIK